MSDYYDRQGNPIDAQCFSELFTAEYKRVDRTTVGKACVSTVWLGIDHNFSRFGAPIIFESMIFGGAHDGYECRYSTEEEAIYGHACIVAALKAGEQP